MNYYIRDWYIDVRGDDATNFNSFSNMLRDFINFIHSPASSMGLGFPNDILIVGNIIGRGNVAIGGIILISKISNDEIDAVDYQITTSSGNVYHLLDSDMDPTFRNEYISSLGKIAHFKIASTL